MATIVKTVEVPQKNCTELSHDPLTPLLDIHPKALTANMDEERHLSSYAQSSVCHKTQEVEGLKGPSTDEWTDQVCPGHMREDCSSLGRGRRFLTHAVPRVKTLCLVQEANHKMTKARWFHF